MRFTNRHVDNVMERFYKESGHDIGIVERAIGIANHRSKDKPVKPDDVSIVIKELVKDKNTYKCVHCNGTGITKKD